MKKEEIIKAVLKSRERLAPNTDFEACADPERGIQTGNCAMCRKYHTGTYEACISGQQVWVEKPAEELLKEALDMQEPEGTRFIIINWNNLSDLSVLMDPDTPEPMRFNRREEAEAVAMAYCAWNWKVVGV